MLDRLREKHSLQSEFLNLNSERNHNSISYQTDQNVRLFTQHAKLKNSDIKVNFNIQNIGQQDQHNRSMQMDFKLLVPQTPTMTDQQFRLPDLSQRSRRQRRMISNSSARKKLPNCFLQPIHSTERKDSSRAHNRRAASELYSEHSDLVNPSISKNELISLNEMKKNRQQKALELLRMREWNNTDRFTSIIRR